MDPLDTRIPFDERLASSEGLVLGHIRALPSTLKQVSATPKDADRIAVLEAAVASLMARVTMLEDTLARYSAD